MKKSLLLASLIAAMALAACGKKEEASADAAASAASEAASSAVEAASAATEAASAAADTAAGAVVPRSQAGPARGRESLPRAACVVGGRDGCRQLLRVRRRQIGRAHV